MATLSYEDVVEVIQLNSATDFLAYMRRSNDYWWENNECMWIFRGQWDAEWKLEPSAFRRSEGSSFNQLLRQFRGGPAEISSGWELDVRTQFYAECEAIAQFAELASGARLPISSSVIRPWTAAVGRGNPYRNEFFAREERTYDHMCPELLPIGPLAQHHGVPTRLIDFTKNPVLAAYFATIAPTSDCVTVPKSLSVWALKSQGWIYQQFLQDIVYIETTDGGFDVDDYMRSQEGCFVLLKHAANFRSTVGKWPTLEAMIEQFVKRLVEGEESDSRRWPIVAARETNPFPLLRKVELPHRETRALVALLEREGISLAHLMPTFDNVARTLANRWALLDAKA